MTTSIEKAKKQIKTWESLVKIADKLGFHLSDQFPIEGSEYVVVPNLLKKHLPVLVALQEQNGFHKNYLLWFLADVDSAVTYIAAIAATKGKALDFNDDKWSLEEPDKFSAKELTQ